MRTQEESNNLSQEESNKLLLNTAKDGNFYLVNVALGEKANINARDEKGYTPLHLAACSIASDVIKLLIERGADINAQDSEGRTPLHVAAQYGRYNAAEALIERRADINAVDKNGQTPYTWQLKMIILQLYKH